MTAGAALEAALAAAVGIGVELVALVAFAFAGIGAAPEGASFCGKSHTEAAPPASAESPKIKPPATTLESRPPERDSLPGTSTGNGRVYDSEAAAYASGEDPGAYAWEGGAWGTGIPGAPIPTGAR